MVPVKLTFKIGLGETVPEIVKFLLVSKNAKVADMVKEWAYIPKIMQDAVLNDRFNLMIFSLLENKNTQAKRYVFTLLHHNYDPDMGIFIHIAKTSLF